MLLTDTILAISSPPNSGGGGGGDSTRGIIRIAGPDSHQLARRVLPTLPLTPGYHGNLILPLLHPTLKIAAALLFTAPRSFTGDDVLELHLPNSPALLRAVLDALLHNAPPHIRLANPGEFSARAFFNQKIVLTQAEGIAATINAANETQLRAATSLRSGDLYKWTASLTEKIANLLASIEAGIDFSDEEGVSFIDLHNLHQQLLLTAHKIQKWIHDSVRIDRLDTAPTIVFVGKPNVGKSSLINALANSDRSIVSPAAGTTRDMLAVSIDSPHGRIRLIDVPGQESPSDELRQKMMTARDNALLDADLILHVFDHPDQLCEPSPSYGPTTILIQNKSDLPFPPLAPSHHPHDLLLSFAPWQHVSAKTGHNIPELRSTISQLVSRREPASASLHVLNHRHRTLLHETRLALLSAAQIASTPSANKSPELLAADLRHALDLLGQITGHLSPDEILGRIFSQFCIGK